MKIELINKDRPWLKCPFWRDEWIECEINKCTCPNGDEIPNNSNEYIRPTRVPRDCPLLNEDIVVTLKKETK